MLQHSFSIQNPNRLLATPFSVCRACLCFFVPVPVTINKGTVLSTPAKIVKDVSVTFSGLVQTNSAAVAVHGRSFGNAAASSGSKNIVNDVEAPLGSGANVNIAMGGHESIQIL